MAIRNGTKIINGYLTYMITICFLKIKEPPWYIITVLKHVRANNPIVFSFFKSKMNQITLYQKMLILLLIIFVKTVGSLTVLGLLEPKVLEVLETNQMTAQEGRPP